MKLVDFHVHTSCSDGLLSTSDIVKRAKANNVSCLAITDHDTVSGLEDAVKLGEKYGIKIIPGIELSTVHNNESIHILGFFKDDSFKNENLIKSLNEIKDHRLIRAKTIIKKLKDEFDIVINFDNVIKHGEDTIARPHIAREIIKAGYPYDFEYIFSNFIGKNCKAYAPTLKISTEDGIALLKSYNALVFLAHPKLIHNSNINEFLKMNFDGIEAIYFQNTREEELYFLDIAEKNNLLVSSGSDFHGNIEDDKRHGDIGAMNLPEKYLIKLLNSLNS